MNDGTQPVDPSLVSQAEAPGGQSRVVLGERLSIYQVSRHVPLDQGDIVTAAEICDSCGRPRIVMVIAAAIIAGIANAAN